MKKPLIILTAVLVILITAGCQSREQQAAATVMSYLQAMTAKNEAGVVNLSCPDWQSQALQEFDAFGNVITTLKGVSCTAEEITDTTAIVKCSGSIEATYQNETQSFPLTQRNFRLTKSQGDWLVCGY